MNFIRSISFFFFNDTATTEIYTLSLHDALPIYGPRPTEDPKARVRALCGARGGSRARRSKDRKSTRLNSSHGYISYAVFCLKKKKLLTKCGYVTVMKRLRITNIVLVVEHITPGS